MVRKIKKRGACVVCLLVCLLFVSLPVASTVSNKHKQQEQAVKVRQTVCIQTHKATAIYHGGTHT